MLTRGKMRVSFFKVCKMMMMTFCVFLNFFFVAKKEHYVFCGLLIGHVYIIDLFGLERLVRFVLKREK